MNISPQAYREMTEKAAPKTKSAVNVSYAFFTGGSICMIGQIILSAFENMGFSAENAFGIPPFVFYIAYFLLANIVYVLCDILFGRLSRIYFYRYRDKIRKYLK
jgi:stage V sporulation protein AC